MFHKLKSLQADVATWFSFLAKALQIGILSPLVLSNFSNADAAIWLFCITIQSLQLLFESSVASTFVRALGFAIGGATQIKDLRSKADNGGSQGDSKQIQERRPNTELLAHIWGTMGVAYAAVAILTGLLISAIFLLSAPTFLAQSQQPQLAKISIILFIVGATLRALLGRHISFLYACGHITKLRWWETFFWGTASLSGALAIVLGNENILIVTLLFQTPLALNLILNVILVKNEQNQRSNFNSNVRFRLDVFQQIWPSLWRSSLGAGLYLLLTQGAPIYYAQVGEPKDVAVLLFVMSLFRPVIQCAQVPFLNKIPQMAILQAQKRTREQQDLVILGMSWSYGILVFLIVLIGIFTPLVLAVTGSNLAIPEPLWMLLGLVAFAERLGAMHLQYYSITNHIIWHWANGATAIAFFPLSLLFLHVFDWQIYAFATAHLVALTCIYIPLAMLHSYREFKLPAPRFEVYTSIIPFISLLIFYAIQTWWNGYIHVLITL